MLKITQAIQGVEHHIFLKKLHNNDTWSLIELSDTRIASVGSDGSISICSINLETKKWKQDIKKLKAHYNYIRSLCELSEHKLITASNDKTIKIWEITKTDLSLIKILYHADWAYSVIPLSHQRFASCSRDKTVKIWMSEGDYEEIKTLSHEGEVLSMIKLKNKEVLVSSCSDPDSIDFWNINNYQKQHSIKWYYARCPDHLIELQNGNIALSYYESIVIIDCENYSIVKNIQLEGYITHESSLSVWGSNSFVYVYNGIFIQINNDDYSIIYKTNIEKQVDGRYGMKAIGNGKYLMITNKSKGFSIVKPY